MVIMGSNAIVLLNNFVASMHGYHGLPQPPQPQQLPRPPQPSQSLTPFKPHKQPTPQKPPTPRAYNIHVLMNVEITQYLVYKSVCQGVRMAMAGRSSMLAETVAKGQIMLQRGR